MADPFEKLRVLFPRALADERDEVARPGRSGLAMLVSVLVAFGLWFTFSMRETYTVAMEAPIRVASVPDGVALRQLPPRTALLQLTGEGWELLSLSRNPPAIVVNADGETVNLLRAASASNRLPAGVLVQGVQPQTVKLVLEPRLERRLPIVLTGAIRPMPPHRLLHPPVLTPDSVTVSGPRSLLRAVEAWPTAPLRREGVDRSFVQYVPLSDTFGALVTHSVRQVRVDVRVGPFTEAERDLEVRVEGVPAGVASVRLLPNRVRATFLVPTEGNHYDRALESPDFYAVVPYSAIERDTTGMVTVRPRLPEGADLRGVRLRPQRVEYFRVRE